MKTIRKKIHTQDKKYEVKITKMPDEETYTASLYKGFVLNDTVLKIAKRVLLFTFIIIDLIAIITQFLSRESNLLLIIDVSWAFCISYIVCTVCDGIFYRTLKEMNFMTDKILAEDYGFTYMESIDFQFMSETLVNSYERSSQEETQEDNERYAMEKSAVEKFKKWEGKINGDL